MEVLIRDLAIQWSLALEDPNTVGSLLAHYGRMILQADTTLFREVLDQMISERQEQGDSHDL